MNKPILFYAGKNIWKNKKNTAVTVVCMVLFVLCVSITGTVLNSYVQYNRDIYKETYGDYGGVLKNVTAEQIGAFESNSEIERFGIAEVYGYQRIPDILEEDYIVVGSLNDPAKELSSARLLEGRWPQSPDEIVLERSAASKLRLDSPVGAVISLGLQPFSEEEAVKEYRVVGICRDYAQVQGDYGLNADPLMRLPNALTVRADSGTPSLYHAMIKEKDGGDFLQTVSPYIQQDGNDYYVHPAMGSAGLADSDGYISAMLIVMIAAVLIIGVFSVFAGFAVTYRKMEQTLLLLKQSGAGTGHLIRFLLYHYFILGSGVFIVGIPVSFLLSYWISEQFIAVYLPGFSFVPSVPFTVILVFLLAVLLALGGILPYRSVLFRRPSECRQKQIIRKKRGNRSYPGMERYPMVLWGGKSAFYHTEKAAALILSFAVLHTVLLGAELVRDQAIETQQQRVFADYSITEYNGGYLTQLEIPQEPGYGILQRDIEELKELPGVEKCTAIKTLRANILIDQNEVDPNYLRQFPLENLEHRANNPKEFQQEKERFGYRQSEQLFPCNLNGVTEEFLEGLSLSVEEGTIQPDDLGAVVLLTTEGGLPYTVGDTVHFTQQILTDSENGAELQTERFDYTGKVSAIVQLSQTNTQLYKLAQDRTFLAFVNEKIFAENHLTVHNGTVWLDLSQTADESPVEDQLARLKERYPDIQIASQKQEAEQQRMAVLSVQTISMFVCVVIGIFAVFSLCNTLVGMILDQKHTRGILRAIGLERNQAAGSQFFEIFVWLLISWGIGLSLALAFSCAIEGAAFQINWWLSFAAFAVSLILGLVVNMIVLSWMYRKSVVELLSYIE